MAKLAGLFNEDDLMSTELLFIVSYCYFSAREHLSSRYFHPELLVSGGVN